MTTPATTPAELSRCAECGMHVRPREYHPFAACLMFKACHDSDTVRASLAAVQEHGRATPSPGKAPEPVAWRHEIVEPTGQHLTLYSASPDNPWSHWLGQYRDECRYTATPLYASPGKAEAEDAARLDWLEAQINEHGAIHLHDGSHPYGLGLGLRPGWIIRTLRQAMDAARQQERDKQ